MAKGHSVPWQLRYLQPAAPVKMTAPEILAAAAAHIADRATTYDKQPATAEAPKGERSAAKTATAFNAVTGHALTPGDVYLLITILKMVRARQGDFKMDNYEDGAAYFALAGEADQSREESAPRISMVDVVRQCGNEPVPNVWWTCPACAHSHSWCWASIEPSDTGPIRMICDGCGEDTQCTSNGDGFFYPIPSTTVLK